MVWKRLLALSACFVGMVSAAMSDTILVVATSEHPPYVSERPEQSFLTDLFLEIGKQMGVTFDFKYMPWRRCEIAVENHSAWAAVPYVPTPERTQKFVFSAPLYSKQTKFFYYSVDGKRKTIPFATLSDLKAYRIGGVLGYFYETMFRNADLQVDYVSQEEQNFRKLQTGRVDLVPALDFLGWHIIGKIFPPEEQIRFFTLERPLQVGDNYLMTSRDYPDSELWLGRFNNALRNVKESGVYQKIATKHGLVLDRK
ncbi:substrate-binding periplasmic protein [Propionivibrio dicarboxylicus]|uniref:Polar amino acid transport system substrate-binding protein n=1 Tax=Propionivibrio dicarboxylicus TaxID=83767 RepID=A0A1G8AMF8_9RHOO|nr:transporter substrate-binding domain-containing protein [Propionivibrio dicarboxylicus]SDH22175.1 polar amino acid transport system substrate-binding protein [Propionivibrio dicarboxylicus]